MDALMLHEFTEASDTERDEVYQVAWREEVMRAEKTTVRF